MTAKEALPKSRRCTSHCPEAGWLLCELPRRHAGACEAGGYRWHRGYGHSRPRLVSRPAWEQRVHEERTTGAIRPDEGERLVFGVHRLPDDQRTCPAWPTLAMMAGRSDAAYTRWIKGAIGDPSIRLVPCDGCGEPLGFGAKGGSDHVRKYRMAESGRPLTLADGFTTRYSYGGRAHDRCIVTGGYLIRAAEDARVTVAA